MLVPALLSLLLDACQAEGANALPDLRVLSVSGDALPLRIGVHVGPFSVVRLHRADANGFVPLQYKCFGLSRRVLHEVKQMEQRSPVGGVCVSAAAEAHLHS